MRHRTSFNSFISNSLEYKELPMKLEQDVLQDLINGLTTGKNTAHEIIKGHMRLAMAIVSERTNYNWVDDLVGVAFLELTRRIKYIQDGKKVVDSTSLAPYLVNAIRHRLKDFICKFPHIINTPTRTLNYRNKICNPIVPIVRIGILIDTDNDLVDYQHHSRIHNADCSYDGNILIWPEAKRDIIDPDVEEILRLAIRTKDERRVITFRAQGYTHTEIAPIMGKSVRRIGQLNQAVEDRYDILMLA